MFQKCRAHLLLLALVPLSLPAGQSAGDGAASEDIAFWRGARNCGPNCLYLMLSSAGQEVSYQQLLDRIELGSRGTTLAQLRDAALSLGHDVAVYRGTPADLETLPLPVILHLDRDSGDVQGMGHFVLLTTYDKAMQEAMLFDGTTGAPTAISFESLRRMWSGYLLCLEPKSNAIPFLGSMVATMGVCAAVGILVRYRGC